MSFSGPNEKQSENENPKKIHIRFEHCTPIYSVLAENDSQSLTHPPLFKTFLNSFLFWKLIFWGPAVPPPFQN